MTSNPSVPLSTDADVQRLITINGLKSDPVRVDYQNIGYEGRYCHISSKHHALVHGGMRVHGWALWRWDVPGGAPGETIIFAEHHSVWQTPQGDLVDVTPPVGGSSHVLFVRDDTATIDAVDDTFLMRTDLTSWPELRRVFQGNPTEFDFWPLSANNHPPAASYAVSLGFDLSRLATEPDVG